MSVPPLIAPLRRIGRQIWILIYGGALLFIATTLLIAATNPTTPANQLVNRDTMWSLLPSAVMVTAGVYVSLRSWRCPSCGFPLPTKFKVKERCRRCGGQLRIG